MGRKGDIRFDGRPVEVEHASARGHVVRNVGSFTRGSQLVRLRYMMLLEGLRFPVMAALTGFIVIVFLLMYFMMQEHETQLVEMRAYAGLWNLIGLNPDHVLNLTLPDDSVVPVSVQDVPDFPAVAAACSKFWRVIFASILGAGFTTGPLASWFIGQSQQIGSDILKERQERGATLADEPVLRTEINAHNQYKMAEEIRRRFKPDRQEVIAQRWVAHIGKMNSAMRSIRGDVTPDANLPMVPTAVLGGATKPPGLFDKVSFYAADLLWPQVPQTKPRAIAVVTPAVGASIETIPEMGEKQPQATATYPSLYAPYTMANIAYPWRLEQSHAMLIGTTGAGKTTQLRNIVSEARLRGQRCVIFDLTGAFVEAFYDPATDHIMNPMDERCPPWTIFSDCENYADFLTAGQAMIPDDGGNAEPFWQMAARTLFVEMCMKLVETGETSNGAIAHHLMQADLKDVHERLKDTIASPLTAEAAARMAESIRAVFNTNAQAIRFLPDPVPGGEPPFSIRKWMAEGKPGSILFATSRRSDLSLSKKLITLWMDIAVNALMDQPRTMELNTWFLFDEVHALHRLPAIEHGLQAARNFGGAFILGLHSFDKLCETYGKEGAVNLASLARTKLILATPDKNTADECSKWIGSREVRETDEAYSIGATRSRDAATITPRTEVKPLVMPDDLMNLPQLHGYVKFPEGFPAAHIELAYVHYPEIAPGFLRKKTMQTSTYVPKGEDQEDASGAGGREHTSVHHRQVELPQTPAEPANENEVEGQLELVIDPREITSVDVVKLATDGNSLPSRLEGASQGSDLNSSSGYADDLSKVSQNRPESSDTDDYLAEYISTDSNLAGLPPRPREQQISIEERTGQAAAEPDANRRGHHHHRERGAGHDAPEPSPDRDDGMDMGA